MDMITNDFGQSRISHAKCLELKNNISACTFKVLEWFILRAGCISVDMGHFKQDLRFQIDFF